MTVRILAASLLALLPLLALPAAAVAADDPIICKPDGNQQEMNACARDAYQAADKALNTTYASTLARLDAAQQKKLRAEQRAWLKKRDPQCKRDTKGSMGGSIWPLEFNACRQQATEARTRRLADWPVTR